MEATFVIEQKPLLSILSSMQPICSKRTVLDVTTYLLFHVGHKELIIKGTDTEISLQASYLLKNNIAHEEFTFLVSGKRIFDIVRELDGDVIFSVVNNQLTLKSGKVNVALHVRESSDFPSFPERITNLMQLDATFFLEMINKVAFLIPQNNSNGALNGLYLELSSTEMKMTATDGHCLVQVKSPRYVLDEASTWLLPRRAIFELKKILEGISDQTVFLGMCDNQLVFSGNAFNFFTKLLVNSFPSYEQVLNREGFLPARVDRLQFVKTLRRSTCMLSGQFIATKFCFDSSAVRVSLHNKEVGSHEEEVSLTAFTGAALDLRFYAPYLLSGLQVFSQEALDFYLKSNVSPIVFEAQDEQVLLTYLVMPVAPTHGMSV